jgi:hypothetical protein
MHDIGRLNKYLPEVIVQDAIEDAKFILWTFFFFNYSFIHMCVHCLGHFSSLPPSPSSGLFGGFATNVNYPH